MARVLGIGGVFVKSKNPDAIRAWYRDVLGVELESWGGAMFKSPGVAVWSAFDADSSHFAPGEREFMINLRVDDVEALVAQLRARGAQVLDRQDDSPEGRFRYVLDPDGTLIELWQANG